MRTLLYIIAISAACAEVVDTAPAEVVEGMPRPPVEPVDELVRTENPVYVDQARTCAMLPMDNSACAHACDPVALATFVPRGTCATFECPLSDGTNIRVGGCNH